MAVPGVNARRTVKFPPSASFLAAVLCAIALLPAEVFAQVPQLINYQGRVAAEGVNFQGTGAFKFALVNAAGTEAYWTNDGTHPDGTEPDSAVTLAVNKGLYSVLLGDATLPNMQIVSATVFTHPDVHLRVWFDDGLHGFQLLTPDQRIAAVGYAIMAGTAQTVADGAITADKIAPGAVDNAKLANSAISVNAGAGLAGGGTVALGGTLLLSNAGVTSLLGGGGITVSDSTGSITLGSSASSANTPGSIVARDASGDFSAGAITANLLGNAATATLALSAVDFTGAMIGDVTGTQGATLVANVGGVSAANLAAGVTLANAATAASTPGTLVLRDVNGNFSVGTITAAEFVGGGAGLTGVAGTFSWKSVGGIAQQAAANTGYLATDAAAVTITLPAAASVGDIVRVSGVGAGGWAMVPNAGQNVAGFAAGIGPAGSQGSGGAVQFIGDGAWQPMNEAALAAGMVGSTHLAAESVQTAHLAPGAVDNAKLANSAVTVNAGTGLAGGGTVALGGTVLLSNAGVTSLRGGGGITVSDTTGSITLGSSAGSANTPESIVARDASGDFAAGTITANLLGNAATATAALSAADFTGALIGDVTGTQGATLVATVGGISAANLAAGAILANAATTASTPGTLVLRDVNGNFSVGTITAAEFVGGGAGLTGVAGTFSWQSVSGIAQQAAANTGYLAADAALVTITLPAAASAGDIVRVSGVGAGGWAMVPNTGQSVVGFAAGLGPAGAQGSGGAVQFIGSDKWQSMNESALAAGSVQAGHIAAGAVGNAHLADATLTVNPGPGLAGGGTVALGGTMSLANAGVTSLAGEGGITVSGSTGSITIGSNAASASTPGTLVLRDANGGFAAGTITGDLLGNATTATTATTAGTAGAAINFSGTLAGDVTGTQGAAVVGKIGGVAPAAANTAGAVVLRDAGGAFAAGEITATNFLGGGAGLTGVAGTFSWQNAGGIAQQAVANTGYLANHAAAVTITLPATASAGDIVKVSGVGAGGWAIVPNAGQNVVGFAAGLGPAGSQGASGAVQFIGNGAWQPVKESQLADGAVGSAQLAPNLTLSGTMTAASFTGGGQGLTNLSATNLTAGTLGDTLLSANVPRLNAATNIFTGTLKPTGTFDATSATVLGFDKISRSAANTWTGPQTFADLTIASAVPNIFFQNSTTTGNFGLGLSTEGVDLGHDFFIMGINMKATPAGFAINSPRETAWGLALERDFFNGETFLHEAYFTDGGSIRPFLFGYSQAATANVVSIVAGTVTIHNAQVDDFLRAGLRFQFKELTGNTGGVAANTFYEVHSVIDATHFTFRERYNGPVITGSATGGIVQRGGWGSAGFTVQTTVLVDNYDSTGTPGECAFQVANAKVGHPTLVRIDNFTGTQSVLQFNEKWRWGTDLDGNDAGNFFLMNLNAGLNDAVIQVDSNSRVAIGYKNSEDGYTPHTNTGTLDVNGAIVATRAALPATVIEGGFIVVSGTAYIGSGGTWRALSFAE